MASPVDNESDLLINPTKAGSLVVNVRLVDEEVDDCILIRPPNFNLLDEGGIGFEYFDEILASGSTSNETLLLEYFYKSGIDTTKLNIIYAEDGTYKFENFIHFSSAEEQILNFYYKIQLLENYDQRITELSNLSGSEFNINVLNEKNRLIENRRNLIGGFTGFEKFLYTDTETGLSYPGAGSILSGSTTLIVDNWYNDITLDAREFDRNNVHSLMNNVPEYLKKDDENIEFITFLNMVGHHFDIIWMYINSLKTSKILENKQHHGIIDELVYPFLNSFGWDPDVGASSQLLWLYAFGVDENGNKKTEFTGKEYRNQIWRRILNNLPYILKHKGTRRSLNAVLACYGVPESILSIIEFGGPLDENAFDGKKYTYEDSSNSLVFKDGAKLNVDWKPYTTSSQYPNAIEFRLNTQLNEIQNVVKNEGAWSIDFIPNRTLILTSEVSAGIVEFTISGSGTTYTATTPKLNLFSDTFTQVLLNREVGETDETYTLYAYEGFVDRIRSKVSASIVVPTGSVNWSGSNQIVIGEGFVGSLDEFRLWSEPLNSSSLESHTLSPDSIDGNDIKSSTEDLIFRLDFEYPKDRTLDPYIKNVAYDQSYATHATASNFYSASEYPYQYNPYQRSITTSIPLNSFTFSNKIRFEEPIIDENLTLNRGYSITRGEFDRSVIDSNRIGVFLSQTKELNLDILKSFNNLALDDYIGNPSDLYEERYKDLDYIRKYYFERIDLNPYEYVTLIKYIDKSIFEVLKKLVPARSKFTTGLLYEPHLLERPKLGIWKKPKTDYNDLNSIIEPFTAELTIGTDGEIEGSINIDNTVNNFNVVSDTGIETKLQSEDLLEITTEYTSNEMIISETSIDNLTAELDNIELRIDIVEEDRIQSTIEDLNYVIDIESDSIVNASYSDLTATVSTDDDSQIFMSYKDLLMYIRKFDVTGVSAYIYDDLFQVVDPGLRDPNNPNISGVGLYGKGSHSIITRLGSDGTIVKERKKIYVLKERYYVVVREITSPFNTSDSGYNEYGNVVKEKFRYRLSILDFDQSDPIVSGNVVEVLPLNGYLPQHYRYTGDLPTGLQNSYFNGSIQTSATTPDGKSPVEVFLTNPNILRVNDTGRGSGEPILIVT